MLPAVALLLASTAADGALEGARWRYRTSPPDEEAGGEARFVAPSPESSVWLLVPARSIFWRRIAGWRSLFLQEASVYRAWHLGAGVWP